MTSPARSRIAGEEKAWGADNLTTCSSAAEFVLPTSEWLRGMRSRCLPSNHRPRSFLPLQGDGKRAGATFVDEVDCQWDKILAPALESVSAEEVHLFLWAGEYRCEAGRYGNLLFHKLKKKEQGRGYCGRSSFLSSEFANDRRTFPLSSSIAFC
eukprot:419793-Hanusia_phi.AAC.1